MSKAGLHDQAVELIALRLSELGLTQAELARRMGWTQKHVCRVLGGKAEPSMASLDFMAHIVGLRLVVTGLPLENEVAG